MCTQCLKALFYIFNSPTEEYEPYVDKSQKGDLNLLRADYDFPQDRHYTYNGRRVAYDKRIINDTTPRVSISRVSIPFQHYEETSHGIYGIYQLPAKRLQQQLDRNLSVLVGTFKF